MHVCLIDIRSKLAVYKAHYFVSIQSNRTDYRAKPILQFGIFDSVR